MTSVGADRLTGRGWMGAVPSWPFKELMKLDDALMGVNSGGTWLWALLDYFIYSTQFLYLVNEIYLKNNVYFWSW